MAYLAVNKDGTELICENVLHRNGLVKHYMSCLKEKCANCYRFKSQKLYKCGFEDKNGKLYKLEVGDCYNDVRGYSRKYMIENFSFWDDFQTDVDGDKIDTTIELPKGTIEKIIGKKLTWEDEPYCLE